MEKTNPFTKGCTNYRTSTLTRHQHQQALQDSVLQENFTAAALAAVKKVCQKDDALLYAMRTAYYTAVENIPICKYPSLLKLQRQNGCQSLCDLKMGENATYESRYTEDELLDACVEVIQTSISKKINDSEFISIMTDESTDIVVKKKCVIYCIVVNENLERQVIFLGNVEVDEV